jgi:MFS family permease
METLIRHIRNSGIFGWLYLANLFLAFQFFVVYYINSSFIATALPDTLVGMVYAGSAALALVVLASAGYLLRRFGAWRTTLVCAALQATVLVLLSLVRTTVPLVSLMVLLLTLQPLTLFMLDIFLEANTTSEDKTGNVRGVFLSMATLASLISPLAAGFLVGEGGRYSVVYALSALMLLPFAYIIWSRFHTFTDPLYQPFGLRHTIMHVLRDTDLRSIGFAQFLMRFFFSWMTIYMPLYLNQTIGLTWPQIGLVLSIMLLPYIAIEIPVGILADRYIGEKELLMLGILVTGISTAALAFCSSPSVALWGGLLFTTRVGTALIEITTESYFFKHVRGNDTDTISLFRMLRPLAYVLGPLTATFMLLFLPVSELWIVLGLIVLLGIPVSITLHDSR